MHRGYKYRLYPTAEQEQQLIRVLGACRFVWNWALELRTRTWAEQRIKVDASARLTQLKRQPELEWLNEIPRTALTQTLNNLEVAYTNFFKKRARYPKFKSRKSGRHSASFQCFPNNVRDGHVHVPKVGLVEMCMHRPLPEDAEPKTMTISKDAAGRWFVSFKVRIPDRVAPVLDTAVGVDAGLTTLMTLSTGEKIANPKHERHDRAKLARAQRELSRKQKGSKNREKARLKVGRAYARVADRRRDYLHKLSTMLVRENQVICIEDLAVSNMIKNRRLARSISDASWSAFRSMLEYKCEEYGRELVIVNRWYPSSKLCSACGSQRTSLTLAEREWTCVTCGVTHDRDVNAARNILAAGLAVSASGGDVRPNERELGTQTPVKREALFGESHHDLVKKYRVPSRRAKARPGGVEHVT